MPLLSKRIFNCVNPLSDVTPDEKLYTIPHTKEQLRSQDEYEKRMQLYKKRIWTCQSTGHVNLTHEEAWNSEKAVLKTLKEQFPPCYDKPVLQLVHHCTKALDTLVDEAWLMLQQVLVVGERVLLKVKAGGKSMKAVIVKVDPAGYEGNPTSNCNSPSSDKENKDNNSSSQKKWVPPKLLPYKYSIRFENEDSVIHSVPANDLSRGDKPPSKELLRLFIRTYAVRAGHTTNSPWIVDDGQVKKLDLQSKFASFLLSPVKWKADEIAKKIDEETKNIQSAGKGSPRIKSKMDAKEEKRKEKAKRSISMLEKKGEKLKQQLEKHSKKNEVVELDSLDDSSSSGEESETEDKTSNDKSAVTMIESDTDSDTPLSKIKSQLTPKKKSKSPEKKSEKKLMSLADLQKKLKSGKGKKPMSLADLQKQLDKEKKKKRKKLKKGQQNADETMDIDTKNESADSAIGLHSDSDLDFDSGITISQMSPFKKKKSLNGKNKMRESVNETSKVAMDSDIDSDTPLSMIKSQLTPVKLSDSGKKKTKKETTETKKSLTLADMARKLNQKKNTTKPKKKREKSQKGKDPKQMTLLDTLKKKTSQKSVKTGKSPLKSQSSQDAKKNVQTRACVLKLKAAVKANDRLLIGMYSSQCAKLLTSKERAELKGDCRKHVMKKFNLIQEKQKLASMTEEQKKEYFANKAKERVKEMKKKLKNSLKRFEDTSLDLKELPAPKLVATPDGLPNELFGDVAMVTEFISCYSGLLMPEDDYPIFTTPLMKALATGKDGFTYLSRTISVLLQTLLQDQIAEDYEELRLPLSDIAVNPATCSELVRLCLRKQDVTDDKSDTSENANEEQDDGEVPDEVIQMLETQELYQLEAAQKLTILKGLCARIMGTYSVQNYMEEKIQESTGLWREKIKKRKDKEAQQPKKEDDKPNDKDGTEDKKKDKSTKDAPVNNTLLTQFYGKKEEEGQAPVDDGKTSTDGNNEDDDDVISKIKRRRMTAAQAQEERRQKELEDKIRREKEMKQLKEQKENEQFEKDFTEGTNLAKITMRQTPVGTDRNHSRYWIFTDVTPGVYVEKGWVGEEMEYTIREQTDDDYILSSSSSEDEEVPEANKTEGNKSKRNRNQPKMIKCVDTTFPHVGQNLWFTYDKQSTVQELVDALHPKGSRESILKKELKRRTSDINLAIYRYQRNNFELRDCDGDKEMTESFKRELAETELRLRNGGLGGVDNFDTWNTKLTTSETVSSMGECLLECQDNVLKKFRDGIMVIKKKKNAAEEEEEEEEMEAPGIQNWREAVKSCGTMSRLHVLLGILDSCIKWEKSAENAKCKICRKKGEDEKLMLCDDCNQAFHIFCLRPALPCVPKGDWKCIGCAPLNRKRVVDVPGKYQEDSDDDMDIKEAKTKSIKHDGACLECGGDESLILCAECPSAYHLECHDPPLRHPPRGRWVCNDCKNGIKRRTRRGATTQDTRKRGRPASKRKRYVESSEEESSDEESQDNNEEGSDEDTEDEEQKPPPKKVARTSNGRAGKAGRSKNSKNESPRNETTSKSRGRRSAPSPEPIYDTKPKVSRRAPSELSLIEDIINKMLGFKSAWPFWHNVSKKDVPDYYNIIKQPISFQKIKDKLNCLVYGSVQEVIDDVALVFRNAVEYNKVESEVYECIDLSEKYFVDLMKKYLPFYAYNRDCKSNGYGDHMYSDEGRKSRKSK